MRRTVGIPYDYEYGKFPDLFLLCMDVEATRKQWVGYEIVVLHYKYPKPHTMLAIILTEEEIKLWQEKANGARLVKQ
jgi:hypothetical protein